MGYTHFDERNTLPDEGNPKPKALVIAHATLADRPPVTESVSSARGRESSEQ